MLLIGRLQARHQGRPLLRARRRRALAQGAGRLSFTKLDPTCHNLVMYGESAKRAYARFRVGDQFVAFGYVTEYEKAWNEQTVTREQSVAKHIGHDTTWTRYSVDRTPAHQPDPPAAHLSAANEPPRVVGL